MAWLRDTPCAVVNACIEMLLRIDAEESLAATRTAALGPRLEAGDWMSDQLRAWRQAIGIEPPAARGPAPPSGIGIGLLEVKRG